MPARMISSTSSRLEAITVQLLIICRFTLQIEMDFSLEDSPVYL